ANLVAALQQPTPPSVGVAPGYGGSSHVALIKLARTAHIDPNSLTIVPFKGANESVNALLGGHIDVAIATMSVVAPFIEAGKLRAIGIAAPKRLPGSEASIPTWTEQGFKVVEGNWRGIVGPKDLNAAEVAYWGGKIATVVKSKAWAESLKRYDWDADYADSNGSRQFLDVRYDELRSTLATLKLAKKDGTGDLHERAATCCRHKPDAAPRRVRRNIDLCPIAGGGRRQGEALPARHARLLRLRRVLAVCRPANRHGRGGRCREGFGRDRRCTAHQSGAGGIGQ